MSPSKRLNPLAGVQFDEFEPAGPHSASAFQITFPPLALLFVVGVNDPGEITPPDVAVIFAVHREPLAGLVVAMFSKIV